MLNEILKLQGVKQLNKKETQFVLGGNIVGWTVVCTFSDGTSWSGHTHQSSTFDGMKTHCNDSGGFVEIETKYFSEQYDQVEH